MRGRLWLNYFTRTMELERSNFPKWEEWTALASTKFMRGIMDGVGKEMNCRVARLRPENKELSGEYLNIDAVFIDNAEYDLIKESGWDPFALPRAVVELENKHDKMRISYSLWKILCVRSPIRVLICYQSSRDNVTKLKQHLERVIWQGSLMKGTEGDLLIIVGDESSWSEASWGEYFSAFEWRNDRLEKIEGLEW